MTGYTLTDSELAELTGATVIRWTPARRTAVQLADTRRRFGDRCADAHVAGTECTECGAIPGYVHAEDCTADTHPHLSRRLRWPGTASMNARITCG